MGHGPAKTAVPPSLRVSLTGNELSLHSSLTRFWGRSGPTPAVRGLAENAANLVSNQSLQCNFLTTSSLEASAVDPTLVRHGGALGRRCANPSSPHTECLAHGLAVRIK